MQLILNHAWTKFVFKFNSKQKTPNNNSKKCCLMQTIKPPRTYFGPPPYKSVLLLSRHFLVSNRWTAAHGHPATKQLPSVVYHAKGIWNSAYGGTWVAQLVRCPSRLQLGSWSHGSWVQVHTVSAEPAWALSAPPPLAYTCSRARALSLKINTLKAKQSNSVWDSSMGCVEVLPPTYSRWGDGGSGPDK